MPLRMGQVKPEDNGKFVLYQQVFKCTALHHDLEIAQKRCKSTALATLPQLSENKKNGTGWEYCNVLYITYLTPMQHKFYFRVFFY